MESTKNEAELNELSYSVESWADLTTRQAKFESRGSEEWVFRGQSDGSLPLTSTQERATNDFGFPSGEVSGMEESLILEFVRHYHLYSAQSPPLSDDTLEWISLMRHHGAPTRFLDFTFSLLIAAYFALEGDKMKALNRDSVGNAKPPTPSIVAINKSWLNEAVKNWAVEAGQADLLRSLSKNRDGESFRKIFMRIKPDLVCAVSPFRRNERLYLQKGIFLAPGNVERSFMDNLHAIEGHDANVIDIFISPNSAAPRKDMLRRLDQCGINSASLFPGLDGFARSLKTRMLLFECLKKMEGTGARISRNIDLEILNSRRARGI